MFSYSLKDGGKSEERTFTILLMSVATAMALQPTVIGTYYCCCYIGRCCIKHIWNTHSLPYTYIHIYT